MTADHATILVVDDNEPNRELLQRRLVRQGHRIITAASGAEALERIAGQPLDLVLLDSMMPEMDGCTVLATVRRTHTASALPVIMVTAKDESADVVAALALNANDYVTKPIDFPVLNARINTQLARKRAETALHESHEQLEHRVGERTVELGRANAELRASDQRYRTLYNDNPAMFLTLDAAGSIVSVNRFGAEQLGYAVAELIGQPATMLFPPDEAEPLLAWVAQCALACDRLHRREVRRLRKDGEILWCRETAQAIDGDTGGVQVLVVAEDITENRRLTDELSYQALHDPLTGLLNRRAFQHRLHQLLEQARRDGSHHALCYLDLDQFKLVNDTCGHVAGDEMLRALAGRLQQHVRRQDTLARLGGDEFGLLMEHCDLADAQRVAAGISDALAETNFVWEDQKFRIGVSIGLVPITAASGEPASVLSLADSACYVAKDEGRRRVHVHQGNDQAMARRFGEMRWVSRIERAFDEDRFCLYCQPIRHVDPSADDGGLHGEVLLRLRTGPGKVATPAAFLPAAERYGLAQRIDRWVIDRVFSWLRDRPTARPPLSLCSINLSGLSLGDDDLLQRIVRGLEDCGLAPETICFEVTETAAISSIERGIDFIRVLKRRGCRFALDDFGSGLSSFAYLRALPVDFLKIDGQFVRKLDEQPFNLAVVKSIQAIATEMGLRTIAEFVDTEATLQILRGIGIDYAQGHYIGEARPIEEMYPATIATNQAG